MELLDALDQTFDHATKVMAGVDGGRLDAPTPCREWGLGTLVAHTFGVVANMGRGARGEAPQPAGGPDALPADLAGSFRAEADRTLAAWRTRSLDDQVDVGPGPMPAGAALGINLLDTATHSWDIARATGQDPSLPDDLAETVLAVCRGFVTDEIRAGAGFDPAVEVADEASPTDRLVAFLGRRP